MHTSASNLPKNDFGVLIISSRADRSGGPRHIWSLVSELKHQVPQIRIYGAFPHSEVDDFQTELKSLCHETIEIPHRKFSIAALFKIAAFIKQRKISIVHSHGRGGGIYSRTLAFMNVKIIHTFHGVHAAQCFGDHIKHFIEICLRPFTSWFISVSNDELRAGTALGLCSTTNTSVIYNGVDILTQFANDRTFKSAKAASDNFVIGSMTRLDPIKDPRGLIARLQAAHAALVTNLKIILCGQGLDTIVNHDHIDVIASTPEPRKFLRTLDLYVSHSRSEGMPLAVLEAMAEGVPCLLSNVSGHAYFIENGAAAGFILDDDDSFVERVKFLRDHTKERASLGQKGREFVERHHSTVKMVNETLAVYRAVLT